MDYAAIAPLLRHLWSPVVAVGCAWRGVRNAQICVSIGGASIVPQRMRVLAQVYKRNYSHELIHASRAFSLSFLGPGQLDLLHDLGFSSGRGRDKLAGVPHRLGATGSPILTDCWGYLDCRVVSHLDGGDMTAFLAEVVDGATTGDPQPMWWPEVRARLPQSWLREWDAKMELEIAFSLEHMPPSRPPLGSS